MIIKSEFLQIRIKPNDKAIIKKAADIDGVSIGEFVRQSALEQAKIKIEKGV